MKNFVYFVVILTALGFLILNCQETPTSMEAPVSPQGEMMSFDKPSDPVTKNFGDITLSGGFQSGNFPVIWDLTSCDLTISFTYDGNGLVDDAGAHAWAQCGLRALGYGNFNPTWLVEGAGIWLATDYDWTVGTFDPDPVGAPTQDLDDKMILQKAGGHGEGDYDLPSAPPTPGNNHRVWFDRDGVDQWQAQSPLAVDGGTYNTGGTYEIVITLHATSATSGEAFMSINGLDQGFETDGNWNTMELTPAGMTFTGDMSKMQVFYGLYGYGATHNVNFENITVDGCLGTIMIDGCDTGVEDRLYEDEFISELIEDCALNASNHGEFVNCVAHLTNAIKRAGIITGQEKGAIQSCAAQSSLP